MLSWIYKVSFCMAIFGIKLFKWLYLLFNSTYENATTDIAIFKVHSIRILWNSSNIFPRQCRHVSLSFLFISIWLLFLACALAINVFSLVGLSSSNSFAHFYLKWFLILSVGNHIESLPLCFSLTNLSIVLL